MRTEGSIPRYVQTVLGWNGPDALSVVGGGPAKRGGRLRFDSAFPLPLVPPPGTFDFLFFWLTIVLDV